MRGNSFINNRLEKRRQIRESAEFERFLDAHEKGWQEWERSRQRGFGSGSPVIRPAITRDDLGGAEVISRLRKSQSPEAEIQALIASAERAGDRQKAARLTDFRNEFAFQADEIRKGLRQQHSSLSQNYAQAGIGELGRREMERKNQQYMTPLALPSQNQSSAQQGGADVTLKKSAQGETYGSISGSLPAGTATLGKDGRLGDGYADIAQALRNNLQSLESSGSNPELLRNLQQLKSQIQDVDNQLSLRPEDRKRRKQDFYRQVEALLLAAKTRGTDAASAPPQASGETTQQPSAAQRAADLSSSIDKVLSAPEDKRAEVARQERDKRKIADPWGEPKPIDADEVRANQERDQQARYDRERRARGTDEREPGEADAPRQQEPAGRQQEPSGSDVEQRFDRTRQALLNAGFSQKVSNHIAALDAISPRSLIGGKSQINAEDIRRINQLNQAKVSSVIAQLNDKFDYPRSADGFDAVRDAQERVSKELLDKLVAQTFSNQDTKSTFADISRELAGKSPRRVATNVDKDAPIPEDKKRQMIQSRVADYIANPKLKKYADQIGDVIYSNTEMRTGSDLNKVADYVTGQKGQEIVNRITRLRQVMNAPAGESIIDTQLRAQQLINDYEPNYGDKNLIDGTVGQYVLNGGEDIEDALKTAKSFDHERRYSERIGKPDFSKRDTRVGEYPEGQVHKSITQKGLQQISDVLNGSDMPVEENEQSPAAQEAKQRGLRHVGFGMYADSSGRIVARTVDGKLVPVNQDEVDTISDVLGLKYLAGAKPKAQDAYAEEKGWTKLSSVPNTYQTSTGTFVRYVPGTKNYEKIEAKDIPAKWHANQQGFTPVGGGVYVKNGKEFKWNKKTGKFEPKAQKKGRKGKGMSQKDINQVKRLFKNNNEKIRNEHHYGKQFDKSGKDPSIQNHLEMRQARIAAVRSQLNKLWDALKGEKNPVIRDRLKNQIKQLDKQVGLEYLALERLKELANITTQTNKAASESIADLQQAMVETSKANSDATGNQSAVFTVMGNLEKAGENAVKAAFGDKGKSGKSEKEEQEEREVIDGLPGKQEAMNIEDYWKDLTFDDFQKYEEMVDQGDDELFAELDSIYDLRNSKTEKQTVGDAVNATPPADPAPKAERAPRQSATARRAASRPMATATSTDLRDPTDLETRMTHPEGRSAEERARVDRDQDVRNAQFTDAGKAGSYSDAINNLSELELDPPYDNLRDVAVRLLQRAQEERVKGTSSNKATETQFARKPTWDHASELPTISKLISVGRTNDENDIQNAFDLADFLDRAEYRGRGDRLTDGEKYYATLLLNNVLGGKNNASFANVADVLAGQDNEAGKSLLKQVVRKAREMQKQNPLKATGTGDDARGGEDFYTDISNQYEDQLKNVNLDADNRALKDGMSQDNADLSDNEERPLPKLSRNMRRNPDEIEDRLYAFFVKGKGNQKMPEPGKDREIIQNITDWAQGNFNASERNTPYGVGTGKNKKPIAYDDSELQGNMVREPTLDELERWQENDDMSRYTEEEKRYLRERLRKLSAVREKNKEKMRGASTRGMRNMPSNLAVRKGVLDDDDIKEALTFMANIICESWQNREEELELIVTQARIVQEMMEMQAELQKENQFLSEESGLCFHLNETIELEIYRMCGVDGMPVIQALHDEIQLLDSAQYLRYRLAEHKFKELNPYYSFAEKFASALHAAHYGTEPETNKVTRLIESTDSIWGKEEFLYELAANAVHEVLVGEQQLNQYKEHCGCEEKDKLLVDKGPQRVKETPAQAKPAPSRSPKPKTAAEIVASHKTPRQKLRLR